MLFSRRVVWPLMLLYLLPDGRRENRGRAGWEGSASILLAFLANLVVYMEESEGILHPIILDAFLTTDSIRVRSCTDVFPYQTRMEKVSTLSIVDL